MDNRYPIAASAADAAPAVRGRSGARTAIRRAGVRRAALLVALATVVALALAFQVRARVVLDLGGKFDSPFVARFNDGEVSGGQTYRWTRAESQATLPALDLASPWVLRLRLNGYRPNPPAPVALYVNGVLVQTFRAASGWQVYTFAVYALPPPDSGNETITLATNTFVPKDVFPGANDPRPLGVAVDWIEAAPARSTRAFGTADYWLDPGSPPIAPPLLPLAGWAFALALLYSTARLSGVAPRPVNALFALLIVLLALGFAFARLYIADYTVPFLYLALGLALLAAGIRFLAPRALVRLGLQISSGELGALAGIALAQAGLKLGGMLYPQFHASDVLFHAHRLEFVAAGKLFFTSLLPDAAERVVPYPPALYVFLTPLANFVSDHSTLIQVTNVLADTVLLFGVYLLGRRIFQDARAGFLAAFLFAFNPVAFWIYSWGNHTNIFAQFAATLLFGLLVARPPGPEPRLLFLPLFLFLAAALAHLGVFLSLLVWLPLALAALLGLRGPGWRGQWRALIVLFAVGVALAWLLYYGEFAALLAEQAQRYVGDFAAGRAAGGSAGFSLARSGPALLAIADQLGLALLACGLAGLPLVWQRLDAGRRALFSTWLLTAALFGAISLASAFSARFTLWAAPALALSGGALLARLTHKYRFGFPLAGAVCLLAFGQTLWLWLDRIVLAYH